MTGWGCRWDRCSWCCMLQLVKARDDSLLWRIPHKYNAQNVKKACLKTAQNFKRFSRVTPHKSYEIIPKCLYIHFWATLYVYSLTNYNFQVALWALLHEWECLGGVHTYVVGYGRTVGTKPKAGKRQKHLIRLNVIERYHSTRTPFNTLTIFTTKFSLKSVVNWRE